MNVGPYLLLLVLAGALVWSATRRNPPEPVGLAEKERALAVKPRDRTEADWKRLLTPHQYHVLREKGTERAYTGKYWNTKTTGVYHCAGCDLPLFESDTKFDSGCGWPSFFRPLEGANIKEHVDTSLGVIRTEVTCSRCGGHLGHVFDDGPAPTGLRYCINSVSVDLVPAEKAAAEEDAP